jgi:hypothetical protein
VFGAYLDWRFMAIIRETLYALVGVSYYPKSLYFIVGGVFSGRVQLRLDI